jgi:hypothetical protein
MTWNAANLTHPGRELALVNPLVSNRADVMVVTEAELPSLLAASLAVPGYTSFLSPMSAYLDKCRVLTLVRSSASQFMTMISEFLRQEEENDHVCEIERARNPLLLPGAT